MQDAAMTMTPRGLRVVAALEGSKGLIVLLAGFGVLAIVDDGAARFADALVQHMHLNPAKGIPRIFVAAMSDTSNRELRLLALGAITYSVLRLVEAFGLWRARAWAEWLSIASGAIYIPFELYELANGVTLLKVGMLALNAGIVVYMLQTVRQSRRSS